MVRASVAQMPTYHCRRCAMAIRTALWFDIEADIRAHINESQLRSIVASGSAEKQLEAFAKFLEAAKLKDETGSEFFRTVELQFVTWFAREATQTSPG